MAPLTLSERFRDALAFAAEAHDGQGRKGTDIPYIAHLLAVTAIVLEHGGDEDQAIAAVLHDAIEDQGGDRMRTKVRERFGDRVTAMVDDCTDAEVIPKPPWKERKLNYLAHIPGARADSVLVSMADKLHNATAITRDLRREGATVFERFKGGREGTLWYYRALVEAFTARPRPQAEDDEGAVDAGYGVAGDTRGDGPEPAGARALLEELRHAVEEMERAVTELD